MVFEAVLGTVNEFLDYVLFLVGVTLVYYIFRFFTVGIRTETLEEREARNEEFRGMVRGYTERRHRRAEERRTQEEAERNVRNRRALLGNVIRRIARMENEVDELREQLREHNEAGLRRANSHLGVITREIRESRNFLRGARARLRAERRDYVTSLLAVLEHIENVQRAISGRMQPNHTAADWTARINDINNASANLVVNCRHLSASIEHFINEDNITAITPRGP